ncbi:hypothetical protein GQ43DRAFT_175762 [Delitschia confertaspora ATCC 74209]|uniref:Uncharacterized protein n=1 Tax=Delitschia confertaspora ATCC 74209 TaxID=1513339 RepID=A0A9P4JIZ8_9PLEO|nr:hypothetical protein GQ43DRAFT_175762 [Delitschia confertaspora ATCC 74209]
MEENILIWRRDGNVIYRWDLRKDGPIRRSEVIAGTPLKEEIRGAAKEIDECTYPQVTTRIEVQNMPRGEMATHILVCLSQPRICSWKRISCCFQAPPPRH